MQAVFASRTQENSLFSLWILYHKLQPFHTDIYIQTVTLQNKLNQQTQISNLLGRGTQMDRVSDLN